MKKVLLILAIGLGFTMSSFAQTDAILEGFGWCGGDQNPNAITNLQAQEAVDLCKIFLDNTNHKIYFWDDSQAAGSKWVEIPTTAAMVTNVVGGGDITVTNVGGVYTVSFTETNSSLAGLNGVLTYTNEDGTANNITFVESVAAGTGIGVATANGVATVTNTLPENTTVTDGASINFTQTLSDITGEVVPSTTLNNAVTIDANGVFVDGSDFHVPATFNDSNTFNFSTSGTDGQTVTGDAIIDPAADNIITSSAAGLKATETVLLYFVTDALAGTGGIVAGKQYLADTGNPYGVKRGTVLTKQ